MAYWEIHLHGYRKNLPAWPEVRVIAVREHELKSSRALLEAPIGAIDAVRLCTGLITFVGPASYGEYGDTATRTTYRLSQQGTHCELVAYW